MISDIRGFPISNATTSPTATQDVRGMRLSGGAGVLGGILLYLGDMLYYFDPHNPVPGGTFAATSLATLAQAESWRIVISGVLGVVCAWLYALGAWQVYLALRPAGQRIAVITAVAFAALMIYVGVFHTAVVPHALGAKVVALAGGQGVLAALGAQLPMEYFRGLLAVFVVPLVPFTVGFLYAVLRRHTRYPRQMALLTPSVLLVALHLLEAIPPPQSDGWYMMYTATAGGYANLSLLLFFAVSTLVLWNGGRTPTTGPEHIV